MPEHFSIPFFLGVEKGLFLTKGIEVLLYKARGDFVFLWQLNIHEYPRGTGSMCRGLRNNEIDIAVALTEGVITGNNQFQCI